MILTLLGDEDRGQAADTGSAVHYAAKAFHTFAKGDVAAAIKAMEKNLPEYPLADLGTAEGHFRLYASDPRNKEAKIVLCEEKIEVRLEAPEGHIEEVVIQGTLDQVRQEGGRLVVCDIKTGASAGEGDDMLNYYAAQLAAYQVGAANLLKQHVSAAAIIRTRDYLKTDRKKNPKPGPVFWYASWTYADALSLLEEVRRAVGDVRSGRISVAPSTENCKWCPGGGIGNCLRRKIG